MVGLVGVVAITVALLAAQSPSREFGYLAESLSINCFSLLASASTKAYFDPAFSGL
jgi:hypothetical protein